MNNRKGTILTIAAIISAFLIAAAVFIALSGREQHIYTKKLQQAQDLVRTKDYQGAILIYQDLINSNPEKMEAYKGISEAYTLNGDLEMAAAQLELGYGRTGETQLQNLLTEVEQKKDTTGQDLLSQGKASGISSPSINEELFALFGSGTFRDYEGTCDIVSSEELPDGSNRFTVNGQGFSASLLYPKGSFSDFKIPSEITLQNALRLFSYEGELSAGDLEMLPLENVKTERNTDGIQVITFDYKGLEAEVVCNGDSMIDSESEANLTPSRSVIERNDDLQNLSGSVLDAQNAKGVGDISLTFESVDNPDSDPYTCTSDEEGVYSLNLPIGFYNVTIEGPGYAPFEKEVYVSGYSEYTTEDFILSKLLDEEIRIVLTWGAYPADLDSYLIGETDNKDDVFVYYQDFTSNAGDEALADLDIDDTDGNGPETITLHHINGDYTYTVFDYNLTKDIAKSGASVTVYFPDGTNTTIECPFEEGEFTNWDVFELHDGDFMEVNKLSFNETHPEGRR